MRALLAFAVVVAVGWVAPSARATLVFERGVVDRSVWVADDDGSGKRRLATPGEAPRISPDGRTVVYWRNSGRPRFRPDMWVVPVDGSAPPRVLVRGWRDQTTFDWTEDSRTIVTVTGPELGTKRLELIDVATGARRVASRGFFYGASFSPADDELVFGRATADRFPARSDVFRVAVTGGTPRRITRDRRSLSPLWGPTGRIVFVKLVDAKRRRYGPKNELYLMAPDGSGVRRLTRTKVDPLLFGLTPTEWSGAGDRLLAQFGGQDTSYAETVDPATGAHRALLKAEEPGLIATDLTADGSTVLGATGGYEQSARHDIVAVPYTGGEPTVLVRNGFNPDWNR